MVAIGRALMARPELIIFDELSLGLAPIVIDLLYEAIIKINGLGTTIVLVEQNVHRSLEVVDRAYIIERGRIALSGTAEELSRDEHVKDHADAHYQQRYGGGHHGGDHQLLLDRPVAKRTHVQPDTTRFYFSTDLATLSNWELNFSPAASAAD